MWGFQWLFDFCNAFWDVVWATFIWCVEGVIAGIGILLYGIVDGLLLILETLIQGIDCSSLVASMAANYDLLPTQLIYVINAICLPQGIAIIVSAIAIRMALNLIPAAFTRI